VLVMSELSVVEQSCAREESEAECKRASGSGCVIRGK